MDEGSRLLRTQGRALTGFFEGRVQAKAHISIAKRSDFDRMTGNLIAKRLVFDRMTGISIAKRLVFDQRGSASVEFVLLALPLFIPILIFLGQFSTVSSNEMVLQTLSRESLRSFVESNNDSSGEVLVRQVIEVGGRNLGLSEKEIDAIHIEMMCSKSPCHLPNGRVRITLTMDPSVNHGRIVKAAAQEYFSPWIQS